MGISSLPHALAPNPPVENPKSPSKEIIDEQKSPQTRRKIPPNAHHRFGREKQSNKISLSHLVEKRKGEISEVEKPPAPPPRVAPSIPADRRSNA